MELVNTLIRKYKTRKKNAFLNQPLYQSSKKYAFVGVGMHSLSNLYPILHYFNISLKYIYSDSGVSAGQMAARFPGSVAAESLEQIAGDAEVAAVFVCMSPTLHFRTACRLLEAGKHVYLEKPPCYSLAELNTIIQKRKGIN
jgi:virulence factor